MCKAILQAAWIVDDTDERSSDSDDNNDDGMVLDENERGIANQEHMHEPDFEDDQASLNFRESDEETENNSVMMVINCII